LAGEDIVHARGNTWINMNKAPVAEAVGGSSLKDHAHSRWG
jgi:hypothetical protein